ncbi:MAG: hypothetical protein HWN80_19160 [Candidatus Lokiarchaeota archaeon]|nr:hypothetical protein [Candidatus Lokiarchaeota archaeon]
MKINTQITDSYEKYLNVIIDYTRTNNYVTSGNLAKELKLHRSTVQGFLKAKKEFFDNFLKVNIGKNRVKFYSLTKKGKRYIELIQYIKEYYKFKIF